MRTLSKARQLGFHDTVDSKNMFVRQFEKILAERIIPAF